MRDLSFFLRLHALPPLARPSGSLRKPYLPLEVRYTSGPPERYFCTSRTLSTGRPATRIFPCSETTDGTGSFPLPMELQRFSISNARTFQKISTHVLR